MSGTNLILGTVCREYEHKRQNYERGCKVVRSFLCYFEVFDGTFDLNGYVPTQFGPQFDPQFSSLQHDKRTLTFRRASFPMSQPRTNSRKS